MIRAWLMASLLLLPTAAMADETADTHAAALAMIPAAERLEKPVKFGDAVAITVVTDKRLARTPKLPPEEPTYQKAYDDAGVYMVYVTDVKLKAEDADYHVLRCDSGGSDDPQCVLSTTQDPNGPGVAIPGRLFVIPGDGCVYSAGHADTMFDTRAVHCLVGAELKPVAQPFNYAGLKSKALKELTLYSDKSDGAAVTKIEKGQFVEVVLQDGDWFLLRNRFGLTGWAKLATDTQQATEIEGFYYAGD
ncbi:MAG TPA: SH3 domain-containing protein [Dongiaceae bacterium]|nr:SH3 domain-containing protein [Dongiaceae bacterium]